MKFVTAILATALIAPLANAHKVNESKRPDGHAPIGVMGDHTHKAGEWMASYRYMRMEMEGSLDGSDGISNS